MAPYAEPAFVPTPVFAARDTVVTVFSIIESPEQTGAPTAKPAKKLTIGPIVGGLVGGVAAGLLLTAFVIWYVGYRKRKRLEALAVLERRQRRLANQRNAKSRQSLTSTRASTSGSKSQLFSTAGSKSQLFKSSDRISGLGFDPSIPVAAPRRPRNSYASAKQYDQFANEKGYGYEPQPMAYVHTGGEYFVQVPYEQPSIRDDHGIDYSETNSSSADSQKSPPTSPNASKRSSRRSNPRVLSADKTSLAAAMPATSRHRPARPSPLSYHADKMAEQPPIDFGSPQPDDLSPNGSSSNGSTQPPSYDSHAYASAASGAWGVALGDPTYDKYSKQKSGSSSSSSSPPRGHEKSKSGQYAADPFAEYHIYQNGLGLYDEEHLAEGEEDADVIDFSQHAKY
jgi:hypothetical protein